jgi:hypothetical protein
VTLGEGSPQECRRSFLSTSKMPRHHRRIRIATGLPPTHSNHRTKRSFHLTRSQINFSRLVQQLEAQQGHPKAIVTYINHPLHAKSITAKARLEDRCLKIIFESTPEIDQKTLVEFLRQEILELRTSAIERVKIYSQQSHRANPDWGTEFEILSSAPLFFDPIQAFEQQFYAHRSTETVEADSLLFNEFIQVPDLNKLDSEERQRFVKWVHLKQRFFKVSTFPDQLQLLMIFLGIMTGFAAYAWAIIRVVNRYKLP